MPRLQEYFDALLSHYGRPQARAFKSRLDAVIGAVLSQRSTPKKVDEALGYLRTYSLLDFRKLHELDAGTLALAIKPAGNAAAKAAKLKTLIAWIAARHDGDLEKLAGVPRDRLRGQLLELPGLGPETVDTLLLHGLGLPSFVIDVNAHRVALRHELVIAEAGYDDYQERFEKEFPRDPQLYAAFHALLGALGREHCRVKAKCEDCPLLPFMPGGRPFRA
jgi:endonuclease-3 related protein